MPKRALALLLIVAGLLWGGVAPAGDPEVPLQFISVDELKSLLDTHERVDLIDVRSWGEYVKRHINGARSMPLRAVQGRLYEIGKTGLAVFY